MQNYYFFFTYANLKIQKDYKLGKRFDYKHLLAGYNKNAM